MRIPRFPIGAVWRRTAVAAALTGERDRRSAEQLALPGLDANGTGTSARGSTGGSTSNGARKGSDTGDGGDRESASTDDAAPHDAPRDAPHWDELPLALIDGARLRAVTAAAARRRVRAGMTVPEARALCAELDAMRWDDDVIAGEIVRVTAALLVASPQVTPVAGAPGMWWVGAGGMEGVGGEHALVRALTRVLRAWHPRSRVGVADSCVAARAATWADHDGAQAFVVPRGGCAEYLAPAPLALLPMEDELRRTLHALGLRTAGAFAALAAGDVERRWGAEGLRAWRLAHGDDPRRPVLARAEAERAVSTELATPAETMEPVLFLLRAALERLVRDLVADGRAAAAVAITLVLDDGRGALPAGGVPPHTITREVRPARPMARVAPLFERCRALLDRWPLPAPVGGVVVAVVATAPLSGEQGELLAPAWRDPAAADAALARLRAELGPGVVVRPVSRDAHAPERAGGWVEGAGEGDPARALEKRRARDGGAAPGGTPTWDDFRTRDATLRARGAPPEEQDTTPLPSAHHPSDAIRIVPMHDSTHPPTRDDVPPDLVASAFRILESPEPVDVAWHDGVPTSIRWRGRDVPIVRASGPERLGGDWWTEPYERDYWRCEGADGEILLFRDRRGRLEPAGGWYVQGWYD